MSMLHDISGVSAAPSTIRRLLRSFGRNFLRAVNETVAAIIARRERQAQLSFLCRSSGREG